MLLNKIEGDPKELENRDFMLPVHLEATDLNDAWFTSIENCVKYGHIYTIDRGSYEGQKRKEFDYFTIRIKNPGIRPLHILMPEGSSLAAPNDENYINDYFARYLMSAERTNSEDYTYGERLVDPKSLEAKTINEIQSLRRKWNEAVEKEDKQNILDKITRLHQTSQVIGSNQVNQVIEMYRKGAYGTNQATMEIGMPSDLSWADPPCLRMIDTRIRYGKLHFMVYFRSWDLFSGFPSNLAGLQLLKEYMVEEIGNGVKDGEIFAASKGLHIYDHFWDFANKRLGKFDKKKESI